MPVPDWQKNKITIADPASWSRYTRAAQNLRFVFHDLTHSLLQWSVPIETLYSEDAPLDIWIRDWGPVEGAYFRYAPDYAKGLYSAKAISRARHALNRRLGVRCRVIPLVLDGGNLVHNGRIAILTEKVLWQNRQFTRGEIERAIVSLGFERVIFIPVEPGDEIGHSDGTCRFASGGVLLINDYDTTSMSAYGRRLRRTLATAKMDTELVPLPWFCRGGRLDGVPSAEGCYMNFLHVCQGVIVPAFSHRKDDRAFDVLSAATRNRVVPVNATPLAKLGGVFNCATLSF